MRKTLLIFIRLFNNKIGFPLRRLYLCRRLLPLLPATGKILDLGCSDGRLASGLQKKNPGLHFCGADKVIQKNSFIPVTALSGLPYPYTDGEFDGLILIDVLHHEENPSQLLAEAARISPNFILVKDHYYTGKLSYFLLKISDYWGNKAYSIPLPYTFLRPEQWIELFNKQGLTVKHFSKFRYNIFDPCRHNIFVLEKL